MGTRHYMAPDLGKVRKENADGKFPFQGMGDYLCEDLSHYAKLLKLNVQGQEMSIIRTKLFCPECGKKLIRTSDEYRVCPNGHGRLHPVRDAGAQEPDYHQSSRLRALLFQ